MARGNSVVACMLCLEQSIRKSNVSSSMLTLRMHVAHVVIFYCSNHGKAYASRVVLGFQENRCAQNLAAGSSFRQVDSML